jgi:hypothetical protein
MLPLNLWRKPLNEKLVTQTIGVPKLRKQLHITINNNPIEQLFPSKAPHILTHLNIRVLKTI